MMIRELFAEGYRRSEIVEKLVADGWAIDEVQASFMIAVEMEELEGDVLVVPANAADAIKAFDESRVSRWPAGTPVDEETGAGGGRFAPKDGNPEAGEGEQGEGESAESFADYGSDGYQARLFDLSEYDVIEQWPGMSSEQKKKNAKTIHDAAMSVMAEIGELETPEAMAGADNLWNRVFKAKAMLDELDGDDRPRITLSNIAWALVPETITEAAGRDIADDVAFAALPSPVVAMLADRQGDLLDDAAVLVYDIATRGEAAKQSEAFAQRLNGLNMMDMRVLYDDFLYRDDCRKAIALMHGESHLDDMVEGAMDRMLSSGHVYTVQEMGEILMNSDSMGNYESSSDFAYDFIRFHMGGRLVEQADWENSDPDVAIALWTRQNEWGGFGVDADVLMPLGKRLGGMKDDAGYRELRDAVMGLIEAGWWGIESDEADEIAQPVGAIVAKMPSPHTGEGESWAGETGALINAFENDHHLGVYDLTKYMQSEEPPDAGVGGGGDGNPFGYHSDANWEYDRNDYVDSETGKSKRYKLEQRDMDHAVREKFALHYDANDSVGWTEDFDAPAQKDAIVTALVDATGLTYTEADEFIRQWARTSNDEDLRALTIQAEAALMFDSPLSEWQLENYGKLMEQRQEAFVWNSMVTRPDGLYYHFEAKAEPAPIMDRPPELDVLESEIPTPDEFAQSQRRELDVFFKLSGEGMTEEVKNHHVKKTEDIIAAYRDGTLEQRHAFAKDYNLVSPAYYDRAGAQYQLPTAEEYAAVLESSQVDAENVDAVKRQIKRYRVAPPPTRFWLAREAGMLGLGENETTRFWEWREKIAAPNLPASDKFYQAVAARSNAGDGYADALKSFYDAAPVSVKIDIARRAGFDVKDAGDELVSPSEHEARGKIQKALKAMYDRTQKWFKDAGVTHMVLYRGVNMSFSDTEKYNSGLAYDFKENTLSSWTTNRNVALSFAEGASGGVYPHGIVVEQYVPVERILANARTGFGCLKEWEYVVIDRPGKTSARVIDRV